MQVTKRSPLTGEVHTMELPVTQEELDRHAAGEFSQDVWPELTDDQREFLISGITAEEWDAAFAEEDCGA